MHAGNREAVTMIIEIIGRYPVKISVTKRKKWTIRNARELAKVQKQLDECFAVGGKLTIEPIPRSRRRRR